jgi:hypothetical protein
MRLAPGKISFIPADLLIEILKYIVHGPFDRDSDVAPFPLIASQVCRHWKDIVLDSPSVWTNVYLSPRSTFDIPEYLERSRQSLIKLSISFPDSHPTSTLINELELILPLHSERIQKLYIHLCDCHTPDIFAIFSIFSCLPMANLVELEILEIHDIMSYSMKRRVIRAIPKADLAWGQNIQRICVPGSWLHMVNVGSRSMLTTLEIDNDMLSKRNFKTMAGNMPMLTNLILHDLKGVHRQWGDISDGASPIIVPSLRLLRFHDHRHPKSRG